MAPERAPIAPKAKASWISRRTSTILYRKFYSWMAGTVEPIYLETRKMAVSEIQRELNKSIQITYEYCWGCIVTEKAVVWLQRSEEVTESSLRHREGSWFLRWWLPFQYFGDWRQCRKPHDGSETSFANGKISQKPSADLDRPRETLRTLLSRYQMKLLNRDLFCPVTGEAVFHHFLTQPASLSADNV